jgi:hypothetical protein
MNKHNRSPAIVAEIGRPETPEETAHRRTENLRNHHQRQTINNLIYSLFATLGVVLVIVLIVPRAERATEFTIDYKAAAQKAQPGIDETLAVPQLPTGWRSNVAELRTSESDNIQSWFIGLLTPADQFIGIAQGLNANTTWVADRIKDSAPTGNISIAGTQWTVHDNREQLDNMGNMQYALTTQAGESNYVLYGTALTDEFISLAESLTPSLTANRESAQ